jgi:hypothetical protein
LKSDIHPNKKLPDIQLHLSVNTPRLHYKYQSVNAAYGSNWCCENYATRVSKLFGQNSEFLVVKEVAASSYH